MMCCCQCCEPMIGPSSQSPPLNHINSRMSFAAALNMRLAPSAEVACNSAACRDVHVAQPSSRR